MVWERRRQVLEAEIGRRGDTAAGDGVGPGRFAGVVRQ